MLSFKKFNEQKIVWDGTDLYKVRILKAKHEEGKASSKNGSENFKQKIPEVLRSLWV